MNKFAIRESIESYGIVEPDDPERSICSFFRSTITISIFSRLYDSFFGCAVVSASSPLIAFGGGKHILSSFGGCYTSFHSCHTDEISISINCRRGWL